MAASPSRRRRHTRAGPPRGSSPLLPAAPRCKSSPFQTAPALLPRPARAPSRWNCRKISGSATNSTVWPSMVSFVTGTPDPHEQVASRCLAVRLTAPQPRSRPVSRASLPSAWSTSAASRSAVTSTAFCPAAFNRRRPSGRSRPHSATSSLTTRLAAGLLEYFSVPARRAPQVAAVHRNRGVQLGERAIPGAPGQEQRQADGHRIPRAQLVQHLQGRQPRHRAFRQFLAAARDDPDLPFEQLRHGLLLSRLGPCRRGSQPLPRPAHAPASSQPRSTRRCLPA